MVPDSEVEPPIESRLRSGPACARLGDELAQAISELRARPVAVSPCSVDEFLTAQGLPEPVAASLAGFLDVLATRCAETSDTVTELTGRPPRTVRQFVRDHAAAFTPGA